MWRRPQGGIFLCMAVHPEPSKDGPPAQLENRNWKREKRKTPPFDYVEGWATQKRFSELRRGHPPFRLTHQREQETPPQPSALPASRASHTRDAGIPS